MRKLLLIFMLFSLAACSKGDNDDFNRDAANRALIGTWQHYVDGEPRDPETYIQFNEGYTTRSYYIDRETGEEKETVWGPNYSLEEGFISIEYSSRYRYEIINGFLYLYPPPYTSGYFLFKKVK